MAESQLTDIQQDGQVAVSPQSTVSYTSYVADGTVYQTVWDAASSPDAGASYQVHSSKAKDKPFRCDYCSNTYSRQCDLEYVFKSPRSRRGRSIISRDPLKLTI
jgi:hypothetical protein